ncbi:hypothetical protein V6N11_020733 [Hibiscus sabdariffa]|uniref:Uncharacterized protein n=1 Tax=Hibiscus sabdariffa TaxID=183260 RepID=A0ABR2Q9M7_9ROSI
MECFLDRPVTEGSKERENKPRFYDLKFRGKSGGVPSGKRPVMEEKKDERSKQNSVGEDPSAVLPSSPTDLCINCTPCEHPCHPLPPPPPLSSAGYPSYTSPPPPPPSHRVKTNCPPPPVQCCEYPMNLNPNPNEYYHPMDDNHSATPRSPISSSFSLVIILVLFLALHCAGG